MIRRRRSPAIRAVLLATVVALIAAIPAFGAASTPAAPTTIVHSKVARAGNYLVIVDVPSVPNYETISIYAGSQARTAIALPENEPTSYAFYLHLSHRRYTVRLVSTGSPLKFTVSASRQTTSPTSAGRDGVGATGPTGSTGSSSDLNAPLVPGVHDFDPPTAPYKQLEWSDEFDGPAGTAPNPAIWGDDLSGNCGPGALSTPTADVQNAELDGNGNLDINAVPDGAGGYTSAQLDSEDLFSFEYGRIAARIWMPPGSGLCSAFWLVGDSVAQPCFPGCGEIDIAETISEYPDRVFADLHGPVDGSANFQQWQQYVDTNEDLTAGYHTYGLSWTPTSITWTLDGVPYATASPQSLPASAQWVFTGHPFHVILDTAVGGWPGPPAAGAPFPATMKVAWIRLYG